MTVQIIKPFLHLFFCKQLFFWNDFLWLYWGFLCLLSGTVPWDESHMIYLHDTDMAWWALPPWHWQPPFLAWGPLVGILVCPGGTGLFPCTFYHFPQDPDHKYRGTSKPSWTMQWKGGFTFLPILKSEYISHELCEVSCMHGFQNCFCTKRKVNLSLSPIFFFLKPFAFNRIAAQAMGTEMIPG